MQQFRPLLRSEVHFIRTVCALNDEQTKLIGREGEKALREAAKEWAVLRMAPRHNRDWNNPQRIIEERLAQAVAAHLAPEQAERYRAEAAARAAYRKEVAIRSIVASFDKELSLSPEQCKSLAEAIEAHWNDDWTQSLDWILHVERYLPKLPDSVVGPVLSDAQKEVYRGKSQDLNFLEFIGVVAGIERQPWEEDEPAPQPLEGPPAPAPPAAPKRAVAKEEARP
jgi:hypothetical protein